MSALRKNLTGDAITLVKAVARSHVRQAGPSQLVRAPSRRCRLAASASVVATREVSSENGARSQVEMGSLVRTIALRRPVPVCRDR